MRSHLYCLLLSGLMISMMTYPADAQSAGANASAPQKNDSVFSATDLASFPLTRASNHRTFSLTTAPPGTLTCYVFLSPECPLCQNYTLVLNALHTQFGNKLRIYGIVPGKTYGIAAVNAFAAKYNIGYPLLIDETFRLSHYLQAGTTPEVVLLDTRHELVYRGAIDNWYLTLGKHGAKATEYYLRDAIDKTLNGLPVVQKRVRPVGCLINDL